MPLKQENAMEDSAAVAGDIVKIFETMHMTYLTDPKIYLGMPMPILLKLQELLALQVKENEGNRYRNRLRYAGIDKDRTDHTFKWDDDAYPAAAPGSIEQALSIEFISKRKNLVVVGPPGVGKTMLVTIVICKAIKAGFTAKYKTAHEIATELCEVRAGNSLSGYIKKLSSCDVLAIEDLPFANFDNQCIQAFFSIIDKRYERKTTLVTTNHDFDSWSQYFPDKNMAMAIIGRLTQDAVIVNMNGAKDMRLAHAADALGIVLEKTEESSATKHNPHPHKV